MPASDAGETSGIQTTVEAATSEDAKRQELKQQLKQPPLKMPATDAGETSGIQTTVEAATREDACHRCRRNVRNLNKR